MAELDSYHSLEAVSCVYLGFRESVVACRIDHRAVKCKTRCMNDCISSVLHLSNLYLLDRDREAFHFRYQ